MSAVFRAKIPEVEITQGGEKRKVTSPTLKLLLLAWADHANDDGEGMYPSQTTLEKKTGLSHSSVNAAIIAAKQAGYVSYVGESKKGTSEYKMDASKLVPLRDYQDQASTATALAVVPPRDSPSTPAGLDSSFNHPFNPLNEDPEKQKLLLLFTQAAGMVFDGDRNPTHQKIFLEKLSLPTTSIQHIDHTITVTGLTQKDAEYFEGRYKSYFRNAFIGILNDAVTIQFKE
jgi:hypothetical protein